MTVYNKFSMRFSLRCSNFDNIHEHNISQAINNLLTTHTDNWKLTTEELDTTGGLSEFVQVIEQLHFHLNVQLPSNTCNKPMTGRDL